MLEFFAGEFFGAIEDAGLESEGASSARHRHGADAKATDAERACLVGVLTKIQQVCDSVQLVKVKGRLEPFMQRLKNNEGCYYLTIDAELDSLRKVMRSELEERKFAFIPPDKAALFEQEQLFGDKVYEVFGDARRDVKSSGNSLAADLPDAVVFHLMRVVEHGLRALAKDLGVPIPAELLEYKQWNEIIDGIRASVKNRTVCAGMSDKEKSATREFYNGVMLEFEGFKDVFRNSIMHTRGSYNAAEALGVYQRVRDFMQRLATRLT